eukprot:s140_g31.t1
MGQSSLKPKVVEEGDDDARPDSGGVEPVSPYLAVRKKEAELVRLEPPRGRGVPCMAVGKGKNVGGCITPDVQFFHVVAVEPQAWAPPPLYFRFSSFGAGSSVRAGLRPLLRSSGSAFRVVARRSGSALPGSVGTCLLVPLAVFGCATGRSSAQREFSHSTPSAWRVGCHFSASFFISPDGWGGTWVVWLLCVVTLVFRCWGPSACPAFARAFRFDGPGPLATWCPFVILSSSGSGPFAGPPYFAFRSFPFWPFPRTLPTHCTIQRSCACRLLLRPPPSVLLPPPLKRPACSLDGVVGSRSELFAEASASADVNFHVQRVAAKFAPSTLQRYFDSWLNWVSFCRLSDADPLAPPPGLLPDWLRSQSSKNGISTMQLKSLAAWFGKVTGLPTLKQVLLSPVCQAFSVPSAPVERRESLPLSLSFVVWIESLILDPACSAVEILRLGYLLLCVWASLRWGDVLWAPPSRIHFQPQASAIVGTCLRTKITKEGMMPFGILACGLLGSGSSSWALRFLKLSALRQCAAESCGLCPSCDLDFTPAARPPCRKAFFSPQTVFRKPGPRASRARRSALSPCLRG